MALIRPFKALRPVKERVSQVAAVPYDVVNRDEAHQLALDNPWSFLHVSRPEIDLYSDVDPYSPEVYETALNNFQKLIQNCPLIKEETPVLYVYRLRMGQHEQTGIFGTFSIDEYDANLIKKHERTRADKEDDRTRHILKLSAQTGPAFLTYKDIPEITQSMERVKTQVPIYDFQASDQIQHTLWVIQNPGELVSLFADRVKCLYIADGHHRAAAASRTRAELKKQNSNHRGDEDYNYLLAVVFPGSQLNILPYHRVVKDLAGLTQEQFLEKVKVAFDVKQEPLSVSRPREFGMFLNGSWYRLRPLQTTRNGELDVDLLQGLLLKPILNIHDPRTDKRIDFVGGIRGTSELERLVKQGKASVAFSVHPVQLEELMRISDQGGIMPPKSTWFEPKLRDGLVCHCI